MATDFELIYGRHAAEYHELVSFEDWQGNLPKALGEVASFAGRTVVELGAGTGRVTMLVAPFCGKVLAFDRSQHMLDKASSNIESRGLANVTFAVANNKAIPLPDACADIVIEGWSFGHSVSQAQSEWRNAADALLSECGRLLRPGGLLIIIETLGTGFRMPCAPGSILRFSTASWNASSGSRPVGSARTTGSLPSSRPGAWWSFSSARWSTTTLPRADRSLCPSARESGGRK